MDIIFKGDSRRSLQSSLPAEVMKMIRKFHARDLDFAFSCTSEAGWLTETKEILEGFFLYDPDGFFVAEESGRKVGICVAVRFGHTGFIGELVVVPKARGSRIGPQLFEHAISYLHSSGVKSICLDGVQAAVPYYLQRGFRKVFRSRRFLGKIPGKSLSRIRNMTVSDLDTVCHIDRKTFGADRSFFLKRRLDLFPSLCKVHIHRRNIIGFIMGHRGKGTINAGPWILTDPENSPLDLLRALNAESGGCPLRIGILENNLTGIKIIRRQRSLEEKPSCWRMVLGEMTTVGISPSIWGIASGAKG